jgi:hypothetical protein
MIRIRCAGCGSSLNAKEELAGQTRPCPKCGQPVQIPVAGSAVVEEPTPIIQNNPAETRLPSKHLPERLRRLSNYVICDKTMVVATWRNDGQSWMIRTASGFAPARRNSESLPHYGQFVLVELEMEETPEGMRLSAINSYELASRFAMTKLDKGDDDIILAITDFGCLNREQKFAVRQILSEQFMRDVWGLPEIIEYLSGADYHSHTSRKSSPVEEGDELAEEPSS